MLRWYTLSSCDDNNISNTCWLHTIGKYLWKITNCSRHICGFIRPDWKFNFDSINIWRAYLQMGLNRFIHGLEVNTSWYLTHTQEAPSATESATTKQIRQTMSVCCMRLWRASNHCLQYQCLRLVLEFKRWRRHSVIRKTQSCTMYF